MHNTKNFISNNFDVRGENIEDIGYNFFVLVIRYQKVFPFAQAIKMRSNFSKHTPNGVVG